MRVVALKRVGIVTFMFFLLKGIAWLSLSAFALMGWAGSGKPAMVQHP